MSSNKTQTQIGNNKVINRSMASPPRTPQNQSNKGNRREKNIQQMDRHFLYNRASDSKRKARKQSKSRWNGNRFGRTIIRQMGMLQALLAAHFMQATGQVNQSKLRSGKPQGNNRTEFGSKGNSKNRKEVRCFFCNENNHKKSTCIRYKRAQSTGAKNEKGKQGKSRQHYHSKPDVIVQKRERQELLTAVRNRHKQEVESKSKHQRTNGIDHNKVGTKTANAGIFAFWKNSSSDQSWRKRVIAKVGKSEVEKEKQLSSKLKVKSSNLHQVIDATKAENNRMREMMANDSVADKCTRSKSKTAVNKETQINEPTTAQKEELERQKQAIRKLEQLLTVKDKEWVDREQLMRQQTAAMIEKINALEHQNEELEKTIKSLNKTKEDLQNQVEVLKPKLKHKVTVNQGTTGEQQGADEIARLRKQNQKLMIKVDEISKLKKENQGIKTKLDTVEKQLELESIRNKKLEENINLQKEDFSERLKKEAKDLETLLSHNKADGDKLQEELKNAQIQLQKEKEMNNQKMERSRNEYESIMGQKNAETDKLKRDVKEAQEQLQKEKELNNQLQASKESEIPKQHNDKNEKPIRMPWDSGLQKVYAELLADQGCEESLPHFAARVQVLMDHGRASESDKVRETAKVNCFIHGIKDEVAKYEVRQLRPQTLQEAFEYAQEMGA